MTQELEDGVRTIAEEKKRPVEEVFSRFLEWKLGKTTKVSLYTKSEKDKGKKQPIAQTHRPDARPYPEIHSFPMSPCS